MDKFTKIKLEDADKLEDWDIKVETKNSWWIRGEKFGRRLVNDGFRLSIEIQQLL